MGTSGGSRSQGMTAKARSLALPILLLAGVILLLNCATASAVVPTVENPGFEETVPHAEKWAPKWMLNGTLAADDMTTDRSSDAHHSGTWSGYIYNPYDTDPDQFMGLYQDVPITGGMDYRLAVWVMSNDPGAVHIYTEFLDSGKQPLAAPMAVGTDFGVNSGAFTQMAVKGAAPQGATWCRIWLRLHGAPHEVTDWVSFDDVTLDEVNSTAGEDNKVGDWWFKSSPDLGSALIGGGGGGATPISFLVWGAPYELSGSVLAHRTFPTTVDKLSFHYSLDDGWDPNAVGLVAFALQPFGGAVVPVPVWVNTVHGPHEEDVSLTGLNTKEVWFIAGAGYRGTAPQSGYCQIKNMVVTPKAKTFVPVAGPTRIETAVQASKTAFKSADTVVIATGYNFPDALGGASLAGAHGGPLLLTQRDALPKVVSDEIVRLGAKNAVILGGTSAVSDAVSGRLGELLGGASHVTRIGGADRYETAAKVAAETVRVLAASGRSYDGTVFVATGQNFPDALAASPISAAKGWPILLTRPSAMPPSTVAALSTLGAKKGIMLGGTGAVGTNVASQLTLALGSTNVSRLAGADRYLTAIEVAKFGVGQGLSWDWLSLSTGQNYPDALAGGVMASRWHSVLLLTPSRWLQPEVATLLSKNKGSIDTLCYLGSTSAISQEVRDNVGQLLK